MLQALSGSIFVPACGEAVGLPGTSAGSMSSNMSSGSMPRGGLLLCACEGWDAKRRLPSLSPTMPPVVLSSDSDGARICRHTPCPLAMLDRSSEKRVSSAEVGTMQMQELGAGRAEACLMNVVGSGTA